MSIIWVVVPLPSLYFCWKVESSPIDIWGSLQLVIYIHKVFEPISGSCIPSLCGFLVCAFVLSPLDGKWQRHFSSSVTTILFGGVVINAQVIFCSVEYGCSCMLSHRSAALNFSSFNYYSVILDLE